MPEIRMIIIEGPEGPEKENVIQKMRELTQWEIVARPQAHTSQEFAALYEHSDRQILTTSHIGFGAMHQYKWGLNPFTYAEKKHLDHICQEKTLIILVPPKKIISETPTQDWDLEISMEEADENIYLNYWKALDDITYMIWETETQKTITTKVNGLQQQKIRND